MRKGITMANAYESILCVLSTLCALIPSTTIAREDYGCTCFINNKWRHRDSKLLAQGHTAVSNRPGISAQAVISRPVLSVCTRLPPRVGGLQGREKGGPSESDREGMGREAGGDGRLPCEKGQCPGGRNQ